MLLNTHRQVNTEDDGQDTVTVVVEVKAGSGGVSALVASGAELTHRPVRVASSSESRAGNGTRTYVVRTPGLYKARSMWRSTQFHSVYFEVEASENGRLSVKVLGADVEGDEPTTLRALEERLGVAALRAQKHAAERQEREALATQLESAGELSVTASGVTLAISGLSLPPLTGTPAQSKYAADLRAAELRGCLLAAVQLLSTVRATERWDAEVQNLQIFVALAQKVLAERSDARWWIDSQSPGKDGQRTLRPAMGAMMRGVKPADLPRPTPPLSVSVTFS